MGDVYLPVCEESGVVHTSSVSQQKRGNATYIQHQATDMPWKTHEVGTQFDVGKGTTLLDVTGWILPLQTQLGT